MIKSRQEIYRDIDENGISGYFESQITIDINGARPSRSSKRVFVPYVGKSGLSKSEVEEIILSYVKETFNVRIDNVMDLMKLSCLHGKPFFLLLKPSTTRYAPTRFYFARKTIPGTITFSETDKLETLGLIEEIQGDLGLLSSSIMDLGSLKRVDGDFWIWGNEPSKLTSLNNLEYVGGDLNLKESNIVDLGKLKYVGGNLNLRNLDYIELSSIEYIGRNLLLSKSLKSKANFGHINIQGTVRYYSNQQSNI